MYATVSVGESLYGSHLLDLSSLSPEQFRSLLTVATFLKEQRNASALPLLRGKTLVMLFEKPSLRTRVSFEVAMNQLGGQVLFAQGGEVGIGTRETPEDAARVLSRYADAIVIRTHADEPLARFAAASNVPVINGLSEGAHPCQALADALTIQERFGTLADVRIAYLGDAKNNVAASLAEAAVLGGAHISFGAPLSHRPSEKFLTHLHRMGKATGGTARAFANPVRAVREADVVYTDVWTSMGEEAFVEKNKAVLAPYRVTTELMKHAAPNAIFMHCLPAHRGDEMTADVIDGPQSVVFDQAENRMHAQKAVLLSLLTDLRGIPS